MGELGGVSLRKDAYIPTGLGGGGLGGVSLRKDAYIPTSESLAAL